MPTARARHLITETDELAAALDEAAEAFPHDSRAAVLRRLALVGAETLTERRDRHRATVLAHATGFPGLYAPDERDAVRDEWPA